MMMTLFRSLRPLPCLSVSGCVSEARLAIASLHDVDQPQDRHADSQLNNCGAFCYILFYKM
jgi:hypothetical protein